MLRWAFLLQPELHFRKKVRGTVKAANFPVVIAERLPAPECMEGMEVAEGWSFKKLEARELTQSTEPVWEHHTWDDLHHISFRTTKMR